MQNQPRWVMSRMFANIAYCLLCLQIASTHLAYSFCSLQLLLCEILMCVVCICALLNIIMIFSYAGGIFFRCWVLRWESKDICSNFVLSSLCPFRESIQGVCVCVIFIFSHVSICFIYLLLTALYINLFPIKQRCLAKWACCSGDIPFKQHLVLLWQFPVVWHIYNKKLIRRWDSERELSLRRHCTRPKNTIDSCINSTTDRFLQRKFIKFSEITRCNGHYAVQGHSRSPILVPIESSYTTSY